MTIEQQEAANVAARRTGPSTAARRCVLPERDVRRKRPPLLSFLLRLETLRRVARVVSLLVLDFIGVVGALFTALMLKLAVHGEFDLAAAPGSDTKHWIAFAYLVTVLMFARVDLYADRPRRPGLARDRDGAVPGDRDRARVRARQRRALLELLHLLRLAVLRRRLHRRAARSCTCASPAGCSSRPATGAGRCWSARASTSRRSRTRSRTGRARASTSSATSR